MTQFIKINVTVFSIFKYKNDNLSILMTQFINFHDMYIKFDEK